MALQDIITAITAQADREIATLRDAHEQRTKSLRDRHQTNLVSVRSAMAEQVAKRKEQLLLKMKTHVQGERRNRLSSAKQAVIHAAFTETLARLSALPDEKVEPLLRTLLKRIKAKGVLQTSKRHEALLRKLAPSEQFSLEIDPHAKGGFRFVGKTSEADFTFEHLVHGVLRPWKELDIAHLLFGTQS